MKRSNRPLRRQRSTESPCFACCAAHALGMSETSPKNVHIVQFVHVFLPICNNVHTVESTSKTPCTNSISITPFQMLPCAVDWAFRSNVCHQLRLVHCLEPIQRNVPQQTTVGRWMDLIRSSFYTPTISKEVKAKNIEKPSQNLTKPGEWPHPPSKRARPEYDAWSWI